MKDLDIENNDHHIINREAFNLILSESIFIIVSRSVC
jgi:hypothetical protein